jgi:CheY-like chemotaxis protein
MSRQCGCSSPTSLKNTGRSQSRQSGAPIDLMVTDVGLPSGMNGNQVADAAGMTRSDLKVVFITASRLQRVRLEATRADFVPAACSWPKIASRWIFRKAFSENIAVNPANRMIRLIQRRRIAISFSARRMASVERSKEFQIGQLRPRLSCRVPPQGDGRELLRC